jgi:hypothetical protein
MRRDEVGFTWLWPTPGYNFMTDMTDQAIAWMRFQHTPFS